MNNEKNYIEELKKYKKEFNDYLIVVKNEMMNYDGNLDSSPWLTFGARSSKLFNLIEKIKHCEDKIQEELEEDIINNNYDIISNIPKEKTEFINNLNKLNLFRNEQGSKSFTEVLNDLKEKYDEPKKEHKDNYLINGYDSLNQKYYFKQEESSLYLMSENDEILNSIEIGEKDSHTLKGRLFFQSTGNYDSTAFGAMMSSIIEYIINDNKKIIFMSEKTADFILSNFNVIQKQKISNDLNSLYQDKNLQLKFNFILLHPVCFILDEVNKTATYTRLEKISNDMMTYLYNPEISRIDLRNYNVEIN